MIIRHISDIPKAADMLAQSNLWTFDVESTGLNVRKDKLIGFGCCNVETLDAFYIIMKEWRDGTLHEVLSNADVTPILKVLARKQLVTFNGSFDSRITFHNTNVPLWPSIYADVMLMAHTSNENKFQYGLKLLSTEIFGADSTDEQQAMKTSIKANGGSDKEYYKADSTLMARYGLQDNILTAKLYRHYKPLLERDGLTDFFFNIEIMPLYRDVTIPMELKGVNIDVPYAEALSAELESKISEYEDRIQAAIKPLLSNFFDWYIQKEFPYKLSGEFRQKLAKRFAPEGWPRTATGTYSFSKADVAKAVKKGLIAADTQLERYAVTMVDAVPEALIREIQLELLADEGQKYTFNLKSTDHLKRLFFDHGKTKSLLNEKPLSKTPTGLPQVDEDFIIHVSSKYEWAEWLRVYNKLNKLNGTYIRRFLDEQEDGIFYPQFNQHRTTSGRYSGDFQQLPRVKEEEDEPSEIVRHYTNQIRNCVVSAPGHKFVDADYTSLEVVVFADDAGDDALLDIIRNNYDFYSQVAIQVKGLKEYSADKKAPNFLKKHKPTVRQQAKAYALGIRYGEQSYKLHKELNISQSEAEEIISRYYASFPKLKVRMDALIKSAKLNGFVRSKAGRIRRMPELRGYIARYGSALFDSLELWRQYNETPAPYEQAKKTSKIARNLVNNALNFPIQSMAASIVSQASIAIMREFRERNMQAYIALSVHDELCIHCPDSETELVCEIMQRRMENTIKLSVPLQAEPIIGTRYGEVK